MVPIRVLSGKTATATVQFVVDRVGLEPNETATFRLSLTDGIFVRGTVFDRDLLLRIEDADSKKL